MSRLDASQIVIMLPCAYRWEASTWSHPSVIDLPCETSGMKGACVAQGRDLGASLDTAYTIVVSRED